MLWTAFSPKQPILPDYQNADTQPVQYYPGGTNCGPEILAHLTGVKATSETDRCKEVAEEHRLKTNDLVQQTRAADAANAAALLGYTATKIALAGLIGGLLTLVAAGFAAYYARKAYTTAHTTLEIETRPFVRFPKIKMNEEERKTGRVRYEFVIAVENIGLLPANNVRTWTSAQIAKIGEYSDAIFKKKPFVTGVIASQSSRKVVADIILSPDEAEKFRAGDTRICIHIYVIYDSRYTKDVRVHDARWANHKSLETERIYFIPDQAENVTTGIPHFGIEKEES
ncbi:MAG: hypothetical protein ACOVQ0_11315 [Novosphingobium sp.]|uniref:hypothetical protein n=1 Tax=Novosphingobium sp. TaxID=1874826 RepID=UPI003B9A5EF9